MRLISHIKLITLNLVPEYNTPARRRLLLRLAAVCLLLASLGCTPGAPASDATPAPGGAIDNFLHPPTKGPTPTLVPAGEIDLSGKLDAQGIAPAAFEIAAPDGCMMLRVAAGTRLLDPGGAPVTRLTIAQDYPGKLPMEAYGIPASWAYRFAPEVRFSSPVEIVFICLHNMKKTLLFEISVGMQGDGGEWDQISVQGDDTSVWSRLEVVQPGVRYLLVGPAPMGS